MTANAHATAPPAAALTSRDLPRPEIEPEPRPVFERALVAVFVAVPFLALLAAVPLAWGWGLGWHDVVLAVAFYYIAGLGISVGLHRYFTHGSFKAARGLKIALAVAGSLAIEGPVITWVADHRRHHKYSDKDGDPHSPWRFGNDWKALGKGLVFAHVGWLFDGDVTSQDRFCPDWLADSDIVSISRWFPGLVAVSLLAPAAHRRPVVDVLARRGDSVLLGHPGTDRVPAPHHLVDQLDLPHLRHSRLRSPGQIQERLLAGDPVLRRVLAQPPPRRPDLRPPRRPQRPDRHRRPDNLASRKAPLGLRRPVARRNQADQQANPHNPQARLHDQTSNHPAGQLTGGTTIRGPGSATCAGALSG